MRGHRAALLAGLLLTAIALAGCFGTPSSQRHAPSGSEEAWAAAFGGLLAAFLIAAMWLFLVVVLLTLVVALLLVGLGTVALTTHGTKARVAGAMLVVLGAYLFLMGGMGASVLVAFTGAVAMAAGLVPWWHYVKASREPEAVA